MRILAAFVLLGELVSACSNSNTSNTTQSNTPTAANPTETSSTAVPTDTGLSSPTTSTKLVRAIAYGLALDAAGEPGSDSFKILVNTTDANIKVTVRGLPAANKDTKLCPIIDLEHGSSIDACKTPSNNVAMKIPHGTMFKGVHVFQTKGSANVDVSVSYTATDRQIKMLLPNIAPQPGASVCKDNGCNPFFEFKPRVAGQFDAKATWQGIASGTLDMETGKIAAHDFVAHGHPYKQIAKASGSSDTHPANLHISGTLPATEAAVALRCDGAKPLRTPTLTITWP